MVHGQKAETSRFNPAVSSLTLLNPCAQETVCRPLVSFVTCWTRVQTLLQHGMSNHSSWARRKLVDRRCFIRMTLGKDGTSGSDNAREISEAAA